MSLQEILCCLGKPVGGQPHQYVMEKAFVAAGLDCRYVTFEVGEESVADAVKGLASLGFQGAQVDAPLRGLVASLLDKLTDQARQASCVDLIFRDDNGTLTGDATYGSALTNELKERIELSGQRAIVFGHDPAMAAVVTALIDQGLSEINIVSDDPSTVEQWFSRDSPNGLKVIAADDFPRVEEAVQTIEIIVNGIESREASQDRDWDVLLENLSPKTVFADISLNPNTSPLVNYARAGDREYIDGLTWMIERYILAFQRWTAMQPDKRLMREALEEFLMV